ncbi:oxidoreductase (plasmid) [Halorientalis sp. IM1011]|uniref:Gfo/Idh/MocA family protein n=1 Tax=Halorientalis sp. IM1011 TaxID=1932360 RepID=UPI00097CD567|nr:oxidoreductase [Halorientalis sp. IM1011]
MTLRIGFLGYRFMGRAHANALARLPMFFPDTPETERRILIGRDEAALDDAADRLGFTETATGWRDAIDDVDVFYNLAPNFLHAEPAIEALDAGVHVLCEKPLADSLDDAERMATAARESDATAAVAFNYRFLPAVARAKRLVEAGKLGEIRAFRGRYLQDWLVDPTAPWSWRLDADLAGSGALGDLGAHTLDLARYFVGDVTRVSGHTRTFVDERPDPEGDGTQSVTVDDATTAQLAFENGATGTVEVSRVAPGRKNDHRIELDGTEGALRWSLERPNELLVRWPDSRGFERELVTEADDPYADHWWPPGHVLGWEHAVVHENYEFLRAIAADDPYDPDFEAGLAVQRLLDAVQRAAADGGWVEP